MSLSHYAQHVSDTARDLRLLMDTVRAGAFEIDPCGRIAAYVLRPSTIRQPPGEIVTRYIAISSRFCSYVCSNALTSVEQM